MVNKINVLVYIVIAVVVAAAVFAVTAMQMHHPYEINVSIQRSSSAGAVLYPYNNFDFKVMVKNTGAAISDLPLSVYLNGSVIDSYKVNMPANSNATINESYTFTTNGTFVINAVADPADVLDIADRPAASSSINVTVSAPEAPNLYKFIPNNGTRSTQSFTLSSKGIAFAAVLGRDYNLSAFAPLLGPAAAVTSTALIDLVAAGVVNLANGAYSSYSNGTAAYALWMQGSLNSTDVSGILRTYPFGSKTVKTGQGEAYYSAASNTVSVCTLTANGWTKLLAYYNASANSTCVSLMNTTYTPYINSSLTSAADSANALFAYQGNFLYTNSISIGAVLGLNLTSNTLSSTNLFQNSYGYFASSISNVRTSIQSFNSTCLGLVYYDNSTNTTMCSVYITPVRPGYSNESLISSTDVHADYTATLYSFVNSTDTLAAHYNAGSLMSFIGISGRSASWKPMFVNSCALANSSIGCRVASFNSASDIALVNITNSLPLPMHMNSLACYVSGMQYNQTVNTTLQPGASITENVTCRNFPVPVVSATTSYALYMNYTYSGVPHQLYGHLNATNAYLG